MVSRNLPPYNCLITNEEVELLRLLKNIEEDKKGVFMTKKDFENALNRTIEAILDGEQPVKDDILLINKTLGGIDLKLLSKHECKIYLFGVEEGYELGKDSYRACLWEDDDD